MNTAKSLPLSREGELSEPAIVKEQYNSWASNYETDTLDSFGYGVPTVLEKLVRELIPNPEVLEVLDAGCGSGLIAPNMKNLGFTSCVGADFSLKMLDKAKEKEFYKELLEVDLSQPLVNFKDNQFDLVVCLGVTTYLSTEMPYCEEFCRITRPSGLIIITYRDDVYEDRNWREYHNKLIQSNSWDLVKEETGCPYLPKCEDYTDKITCRFLVFRVC